MGKASVLQAAIWHPTLSNRFRFDGFHFLSDLRNSYLTIQTINAEFKFNQNANRQYNEGLWDITITLEDDAYGRVSDVINDIVPRFRDNYFHTHLTFSLMDESDDLKSTMHIDGARLVEAKMELDYANSFTAKWVLKLNAKSLKREFEGKETLFPVPVLEE